MNEHICNRLPEIVIVDCSDNIETEKIFIDWKSRKDKVDRYVYEYDGKGCSEKSVVKRFP